jgi:hypothetical protein
MKALTRNHRFPSLTLLALAGVCALGMALSARAETVVVESKLESGTDNPAWKFVSGKWGKSKNKSKQKDETLIATNVASCQTSSPAPAFKVTPELKTGSTYSLEVTVGTSKNQTASPDLVVSVKAEGVKDSSLPETTTAFQVANANAWTEVGKFTAATNTPSITFTYASGSLGTNPPARWYADSVRFVSTGGELKKPE